tara:strand:+ start:152 stop:511 length:360 start_codon:yes stop_codon:yes gene_type:complete
MIDFILYPFAVTLVLIIWFETDAFVEYLNFLRVGKGFFRLEKYEELKKKTGMSYTDYLSMTSSSFFINLISCPICLAVWLNIFLCLRHESLLYFVTGTYTSLVLYFIFKILMAKSDESI